ncbi:MAG: DNA polymerase III subunit beta [Actinobacteria bacterium]|nr:DNA polymerase III subunit beta [Actinomycetota bacterium]
MKITCLQESLNRGLNLVSRAVPARSPLPVLSNVLLTTDAGRLKLAAMNQQIAISVWVGGNIEREGAVTAPARLLTDFVGQLPEGTVNLELDEETDTLTLTAEHYRAKVKGIGAEEFPPIPETGAEREIEVDGAVFGEMIDQVAIAAATDDSRPVLGGVSLTLSPAGLELAAADSYRLAVRSGAMKTGLKEAVQLIVPRQAMLELRRILADDPGGVWIGLTASRSEVLFRTTNVSFVSHLIDGQFPKYAQLIPTASETRMVAPTHALAQAVKIASLFARDGANVIRVTVEGAEAGGIGRVVLNAVAADLGENRGELPCTVEGPSAHIAFNSKFLADCLGAIHAEQVSLALTGPTSPGLLHPVTKEGDDLTYSHVVMPMHTVR